MTVYQNLQASTTQVDDDSFTYPHEPKDGHVWWRRPSYYSFSANLAGESYFRWSCAFCDHTESDKNNYGRIGYTCPKCGAVFIGDDWFGTWMAKEMPEEWAKDRQEIWG